jgi:hypothetical protein
MEAEEACWSIVRSSAVGEDLWVLLDDTVLKTWVTRLQRFFAPMQQLEREVGETAFRYGVEVAMRNGKHNPAYVAAVARNRAKEQKLAEASPTLFEAGETGKKAFCTEDGIECGVLDTWALDHPLYRDKYIECFGEPNA